MPKTSRFTGADIARAMKEADGDYRLAAMALGMAHRTLYQRLKLHPELRALYIDGGLKPILPTSAEIITRKNPPKIEADVAFGKAIEIQNRDLLSGGLARAGIKQATLDKLATLGSATDSGAKFLIASLDLSHRMMIYLNVSLLEQAEEIRSVYLNNDTVDVELKLEWQKVYNDIVDQIGKCYDRTLSGTQALVSITRGNSEKPDKPGFRSFAPEKNVDEGENDS